MIMARLWNKIGAFLVHPVCNTEAVMVREWVEAASFVLVIAACYMMIVPV
jgi:hypothetical protein